MLAEDIASPFADAPDIEQVAAVINNWQRPELPDRLKDLTRLSGRESVVELCQLVRESLSRVQNGRYKSQLEVELIGWLYDFIRANVKRGRVFDLCQVLRQGRADCLGYAKLFALIGRLFGLDAGVIEVVIDNGGRLVPHTAILVRLADGRLRFVDLWYGSKSIRHKRVGVQVKHGGRWRIEDLEVKELDSQQEVCYLPYCCVDAITLYVRGNRHLNRQEYDSAVEQYSKSIELYPGNARFFYNRAIAYENLGEHGKAEADYSQALRDDASIIRILAIEHDEVTSLVDLDARGIDNLAQEMYLLYQGFTTGRKVTPAAVARRFGLSEKETRAVLSSVEVKLATVSE